MNTIKGRSVNNNRLIPIEQKKRKNDLSFLYDDFKKRRNGPQVKLNQVISSAARSSSEQSDDTRPQAGILYLS